VEGRRQLVLTVTRQRSSSSQHRRRFGRTRRDWSGPTAITDPPALRPDLNVPLATHSVFSFFTRSPSLPLSLAQQFPIPPSHSPPKSPSSRRGTEAGSPPIATRPCAASEVSSIRAPASISSLFRSVIGLRSSLRPAISSVF
jgi:hypothetical protein